MVATYVQEQACARPVGKTRKVVKWIRVAREVLQARPPATQTSSGRPIVQQFEIGLFDQGRLLIGQTVPPKPTGASSSAEES